MNFSLVTIIDEDLNQYKADMQEAFQKGFEDVFGKTEDIILPEKDIDNSLNQKNSVAYKAVVDGDVKMGTVMAGQIAGMVKKEQTCKEIITEIMDDAHKVFNSVKF